MNRIKTYAQLLRIPNVFTAMADVAMAWMVGTGVSGLGFGDWFGVASIFPGEPQWMGLAVLLAASASLYLGGMALNDYFDADEDARERPQRPIPSGRVARRTAGILGFGLLFLGIGCVALLYRTAGTWPLTIAVVLAVSIIAYDAWLKRTWLGPISMGLCRFLNVMLGFSLLGGPAFGQASFAGIVGIYIVGVTWFARREAGVSGRRQLIGASFLMVTAPILTVTTWSACGPGGPRIDNAVAMLVAWTAVLAIPVARALDQPSSERVQTAVKTCIFGLIGLDAILAFSVIGWGLSILLLLVPAFVLGRWVYST